jgi:tetratricopeptide (TPR) repeat protein
MRERGGAAALALLLAAAPAGAQGDLVQAADHPLLQQGLVHLYDLDYEQTLAKARQFRGAHPANPLGHLFLAGALWWQYTTESEQLRPDTDFLDRFDDFVDSTVKVAKPLMKSKNRSAKADGYFAAGMALGLRGQMKLANGKFIGAYRDGKKGIKYLKKCVKIDPNYHDALMGLGIFDYQVAVLPGVLKFGAKLLFRGTGDAARGLRRIRNAIVKGRFASNQAAGFLLTIYMVNEHDYRRAFEIVADLHRNFPTSPYYGFIHAAMLSKNGKPAEARAAMRALFERLLSQPETFSRKQLGTICGQFGPSCFERNYLLAADRWITNALSELDGGDERYRTALTLYRAVARDLLGQRAAAVRDFMAVKNMVEVADSKAWAKRCSTRPCGKKDAMRLLRGEHPFAKAEIHSR